MNRLPEGLTAALCRTVLENLQMVFADLAEEAQVKQQAMKMTMEKLMEDIRALEASKETQKEERQREREKLVAAAEAVRLAEREEIQNNLSKMASQLKSITEEKEKQREKCFAIEKEKTWTLFLLEKKKEEDYEKMMTRERIIKDAANWERITRERENGTLPMVLTTAALKQRLLMELKEHAEKWMVAPGRSTKEPSAERTPVVLTTWMVREEWRKLQANKPCLNDDLQTFCTKEDITKLIFENQKLEAEIAAEYDKKRKCVMAAFLKKEEKIRAAELKQKHKLEQQMRKQLEKTQKAELKEKKRREAKEKKEAEKLARKQAKDERAETRRSRLFFWRRSSRAN
ncbi:hypothetical protein ACEWY4_011100 [Coilia grayii]|uniref:Uncharacterized protein n=1 Tax=Coilia grayii TaxID=363190 RepID=A0ABD1K3U7_9TELE